MIFLRPSDIDLVFRDKLAQDVSNGDVADRDARYAIAERWAIETYSEILRTHYNIAAAIAGTDALKPLRVALDAAFAALDAALAADPVVPADVAAAQLAYDAALLAAEPWFAARNPSLVHWLSKSTVYLYITSVESNLQPDFYEKEHDKGLAWALRCAKGEISPDFPDRVDKDTGETLPQPETVRFGKSNHKRTNYLGSTATFPPDPLNP